MHGLRGSGDPTDAEKPVPTLEACWPPPGPGPPALPRGGPASRDNDTQRETTAVLRGTRVTGGVAGRRGAESRVGSLRGRAGPSPMAVPGRTLRVGSTASRRSWGSAQSTRDQPPRRRTDHGRADRGQRHLACAQIHWSMMATPPSLYSSSSSHVGSNLTISGSSCLSCSCSAERRRDGHRGLRAHRGLRGLRGSGPRLPHETRRCLLAMLRARRCTWAHPGRDGGRQTGAGRPGAAYPP